jgi:hypothetical protein
MSRSSLAALGVAVLLAVALSLSGPAPALARPALPPAAAPQPAAPVLVHAKADDGDHDHWTSAATLALAEGGTGNVISPELPKNLTKATVTVETPLSDQPGFSTIALTLIREPSPGKKLMACISMARNSVGITQFAAAMQNDLDTFEAVAEQLFLARVTYCMQIARLLATVAAEMSGARMLAAPKCGQMPVGIKEKVTRTGGSYHLTAKVPPTVKSKYASVKVKCTMVTPTKTVMKIRAPKGKTLRQSLHSKSLAIGLGSATGATSGAKVKVAFS